MTIFKKSASKFMAGLLAAVMVVSAGAVNVLAATWNDLEEGWYQLDGSFTAYVGAMGGVEFGAPMYTGSYVEVKEDGTAEMTVTFQKSSVTIYGVTCDTFIDPREPIQIKVDGAFVDVDGYTTSSDTALDPQNTAVNYVDSITFALPSQYESVEFSVYINSNVMGVQFGATQTSGSTYYSYLYLDWATVTESEGFVASNIQTATVEYIATGVTGSYEVSIPDKIVIDSETDMGEYVVEAVDFDLADGKYVSVTATEEGELVNANDKTLAFSNTLSGNALRETGDTISGTVALEEEVTSSGTYTGTISFTINVATEETDA